MLLRLTCWILLFYVWIQVFWGCRTYFWTYGCGQRIWYIYRRAETVLLDFSGLTFWQGITLFERIIGFNGSHSVIMAHLFSWSTSILGCLFLSLMEYGLHLILWYYILAKHLSGTSFVEISPPFCERFFFVIISVHISPMDCNHWFIPYYDFVVF